MVMSLSTNQGATERWTNGRLVTSLRVCERERGLEVDAERRRLGDAAVLRASDVGGGE